MHRNDEGRRTATTKHGGIVHERAGLRAGAPDHRAEGRASLVAVHVLVRDDERDPEVIELPRVVFPVELAPPDGFVPERVSTWPRVDGRLELVERRLLFMPPCGRDQAQTGSDVVAVLPTVWILLPETREVSVIAGDVAQRHGRDDHMIAPAHLDGLAPPVASLFRQVLRTSARPAKKP